MNANLKKVNIVQYDICNICDINQSQQKCEQCNKHMCLDIKCIHYNNNKICYECSQKNYDGYLKEIKDTSISLSNGVLKINLGLIIENQDYVSSSSFTNPNTYKIELL